MTKTPEELKREFVEKMLNLRAAIRPMGDGETIRVTNFIEKELNALLDKLMPTEEECIDMALEYVSHKSLKKANKGLIKDALIIGMNMFRNCMKEGTISWTDNNNTPFRSRMKGTGK